MIKLLFRVIFAFVILNLFPSKVFSISNNKLPYNQRSKIKVSTQPPQEAGPCVVDITTLDMNGVELDIYFPGADMCSDGTSAPFPLIVFAHGFSMFGTSDGPAENQGNGEHLASWGYVIAIPNLPDDAEERITVTINAMDYLESANQDPASWLYQKIDENLISAAGYSLGGATALAATARDSRVKTVVALDPVYHEGNMSGEGDPVWDPAAEAPNVLVPAGILGAPADSCNAQADYQDIYPLIGTNLKASYHIVDASHCVFADPGSAFCSFTCGGTTESYMTQLSQKYMTAWFNYHLLGKSEYYSYLYGAYANQDIEDGLIVRQVDTFPDETVPPSNVMIDGISSGIAETTYQFLASFEPISVTLPITVVWSATDLDVFTRTVETRSDQIEMYWNEPGEKTITTKAMNNGGVAMGTHEITIYQSAHADFEASPLVGVVPMTVAFKNTSVGAYSSSYWIFGDGYTSSLDHPTHIYNETGSYTVTLKIDGVDGSDEEKKVGYIRVYTHQLYVPFVKR